MPKITVHGGPSNASEPAVPVEPAPDEPPVSDVPADEPEPTVTVAEPEAPRRPRAARRSPAKSSDLTVE